MILGLILTDGHSYFSEEKRHCSFENAPIEPGIPVYQLTNTSLDGRYRIHKEIFSDPYRNVVLQRIKFEPRQGQLADYRCYALLAPHIANWGFGNTGWAGDYKGHSMLFAAGTTSRWLSLVRIPGWPDRSASSDTRTVGRISRSISV